VFGSALRGRRRKPSHARVAVHGARPIARADGISSTERRLAKRAAKYLGLEDALVTAVMNQLDIEAAAAKRGLGCLRR
jgi:hypothetical protein